MFDTSIERVFELYHEVKALGGQAADLYNRNYGRFSADLSNLMFSTIGAARADLEAARAGLKDEGYEDTDLGFPWIALLAIAIVSAAGAYASYKWAPVMTQRLENRRAELRAAISAGIEEEYLINNPGKAPAAAAAGFGLGTLAALAVAGWFLFSSRTGGR